MISWRTPYVIIKRQHGAFVKGKYTPSTTEVRETILGTVQPSRVYDYSMLESQPGGRRYMLIYRFYTDAELEVARPAEGADPGNPGDLVLIKGKRFVIAGSAERRVLQSTVSHGRYLLVSEVEHSGGEVMA